MTAAPALRIKKTDMQIQSLEVNLITYFETLFELNGPLTHDKHDHIQMPPLNYKI